MEPEEPKTTPFRFTDPRQERIYNRLGRLVGPGPAAFYRDACQLLATSGGLASTTHLAAHLLREIESALRDVLEIVANPSVEAVQQGKEAGKGHEAEIRVVLHALEIPEDDPVARAWLKLADKEYGLAGRAHRNRLDAPRELDGEFQELWFEMEAILDGVLDRFEARYAKVVESLDELLKKNVPSRADIQRLAGNIPNNLVARSHFFDHLQSPEWLEPLRKAGFFKRPVQPDVSREDGSVQLPGWPESRYLARVVKNRPELVLEIILEAEDTQNARVHTDFLDAAKRVPAELAARLVPSVARWIESDYGGFLLIDRAQDLVVHLANGGHGESALALARALLGLAPGRNESGYLFGAAAVPRFERWFYKDAVDRLSPVLLHTVGPGWFDTASDLLADAVRYSLSEKERAGPEDHSLGWRPAIEDHGQNEPQDPVIDRLVVAVRDAALGLVAKDASAAPNIVAALEARGFKIFKRIALHVLRTHPDAAWPLIVRRLTDRTYFDDPAFHHEYFHLAKTCFPRLDAAAQAVILGWIDAGPDVEREKAHLRKWLEREPTEAELEDEIEKWRFYELAPFQEGLTGMWRKRYDGLAKRFQLRDHPDFLAYSSGGVFSGYVSPKGGEELKAMSIPELVGFLKTWEPSGRPLEASPEGVARHVTALAKEEPKRFAVEAVQFKGLDPTYVRALLDGFQQAVKEGTAIPWEPVLALCAWVVAEPRDRVERAKPVRDADPDWGWARKTVARLIDDGLVQGKAEIPIDLRPKVWEILLSLTEDPEPTPEYEAKYGGSNMDPVTLSINTVRGEAMHAAVKYGLWVRRSIEKLPDTADRLKRGFEEIPELRDALDRHLDVAQEASPAIRAVYGQWFAWLVLLDEKWAVSNVARIFPPDEASRPLWNAAWGAYVTYCKPYDNVSELLREQYTHAVDLLGSGSTERIGLRENPDHQLAEHLLQLYWRGKIGLDLAGILGRFYAKAPLELRAFALEFIGRAFSNTNGAIPAAFVERVRNLWEWRLNLARESGDATAFGPELAAFGWLFRSGKLDDAWAVEQLKHSLEIAGHTRRDAYLVMEHLAEVAPKMPLKAVECAALIALGDAEGWVLRLHQEKLRTVLRTALDSGAPGARQAATDLVNRLVARGEVSFRDLLSGS
jgi:hypothetical protein